MTTRRAALLQMTTPGLSALPLLAAAADDANTFDEDSVLKAATDFFGNSTEGLAKVIEKVFKEQGRPRPPRHGCSRSAAPVP